MAVEGHTFDGPVRSTWAPAGPHGCEWNASNAAGSIPFAARVRCSHPIRPPHPPAVPHGYHRPALVAASPHTLMFRARSFVHCVPQACDLLPSCVLGLSVIAVGETGEPELVGSAVIPLFSKKGRLKCGFQKLRLCPGVVPDLTWPSSTPGKVPVAARGHNGRLDQKLKQLARRELPRCSWLDRKVLKAVADRQLAEPQARHATALSAIAWVESGPVLRVPPSCSRCCRGTPFA